VAADRLGPCGVWPYVERRSGRDRRLEATRPFGRFMFRGRRAGGRRREEVRNLYVDRYGRQDLVLVGLILALNIADALLTLTYLGQGGTEANPLMRAVIDSGEGWFLLVKALGVGLCVLILLVHKTFRLVRQALHASLGFYGCLLVYHIVLQVRQFLA
jgi:hypothetical protein